MSVLDTPPRAVNFYLALRFLLPHRAITARRASALRSSGVMLAMRALPALLAPAAAPRRPCATAAGFFL